MRKACKLAKDRLVAAHSCVVAQHRRDRHCEAERCHDQRLTNRAGDLVGRRLTAGADGWQHMINAHTVPNNPTNGAVEPTDARMARPDCNLAVNSSSAFFRQRGTQSDKSIVGKTLNRSECSGIRSLGAVRFNF